MHNRKIILAFFLLIMNIPANGQKINRHAETFSITDSTFLLNRKPFVIRCGEMHFARIPREYWQHRLKMAKAMGLNTICAYLFWNYHETAPGKFNWQGMADAAAFCKLAQQEGLYVILRPGPYSCAEWDFGGFPWWLLKKKDIRLRTQDPYYLERCRIYLKEVGRVLAPLQITNGGSIIMTQVENEYGSYGHDKEYIGKVRDYLKKAGFDIPLFTCDGPAQLKNDVQDDIFSVVNFGGDPENSFKALREIRGKGPLMCGEYYPGWFDSWGMEHHVGITQNVVKEIGWMLDHKASFSIYMVHGGTSFGQWAGANSPTFNPQTSSYDYDAPISEAGWPTPKYDSLRELMRKYLLQGEQLPDVPASIPVVSIPAFSTTFIALLFGNLPKKIKDVSPQNMEAYNIGYGAIVYRTILEAGPEASLVIKDVHDYAQVFLDGQRITTLDRRKNETTCRVPLRSDKVVLDILVEAMGRVNYGTDIHDRKGITEKVMWIANGKKDTTELLHWDVFPLQLDNEKAPAKLVYQTGRKPQSMPAFYKGSFVMDATGDTFLDMSQWGKGLVWVNGRCLGRFWNIGPSQTMYLPGVWLKKGKNEIVVLDYIGPTSTILRGITTPVPDKAKNE